MTINDTISIIDTDDTRMYSFRDEAAKREHQILLALKNGPKEHYFFPGSVFIFFQPGNGNISLGRTRLSDDPPTDYSKLGDLAVTAPLFAKAAIEITEPVLDRLKIVAGLSEESMPIVPCDFTIYPEGDPEIDAEKPWFLVQLIAGQLEGHPGEDTMLTTLSRYGYPELAVLSVEEEARACTDALHSLRETLANGIS